MSTTTTPAHAARAELQSFAGELIGPDDTEYDTSRALFNAMIDKRPALIARCKNVNDIASVIRFARDHDLPLAIRAGGHNGGGLASVDDGVVCDLSLFRDVSVDPNARTVRVGGGCLWGEVDAATQPHGLAVPAGIISTTGVAGLTLGGGHGYLTRAHGLTIDNLLSAELVLADGTQVTASADEHPDLFWAIRGGGGNFGVVTEFVFRAQPVDTVVGGPTFWALEDTDKLLAAYREWLPSAPRNVSGFFNFHTIPPAPPFPEEIHLRKVCGIVWSIDGTDEEAEQAMKPLLSVAEPLMHGAGRMPLQALEQAFDGLYGPGDPSGTGVATSSTRSPTRRSNATRSRNGRMPTFKRAGRTSTPSTALPTTSRPRTQRSHTAMPPGRRSSSASMPIRPPRLRFATGRSGTGRRCTRTQPAARMSTS